MEEKHGERINKENIKISAIPEIKKTKIQLYEKNIIARVHTVHYKRHTRTRHIPAARV
jgi:hypothetical protein